jgi:hypothetical protein
MELKMGDTIYVKGFKDEKPEFYCWKHMKDLIGLPTRVFLERNGDVFVTHPILDVVPLSENCVDYEVLKDIDLGYHRELKSRLTDLKRMGMKKIPQKHIGKIFRSDNLNEEESKPNMEERLVNIIRRLEDGDDDDSLTIDMVDKFFGSVQNFINILDKKELIQHLNPLNVVWDDYQNYLLYKKVESDPSYVWTVVDSLSDIVKIGDIYYFDTSGEELSGFFNTNRNDISQESIERIIEGNYELGSWDATDDEYRDVYEQLKPENKKLVDVRIREELTEKGALDIESKLLEKIGLEQGRGYVTLDDNIITRILQDDETMRYVINRELDDVRSDLYSTYLGCYEGVMTDSWYGDIMSELVGEVIDNTTFEEYSFKRNVYNKQTGKSEQRTKYARRYPVTDCVFSLVKDWIYEYKDSTWSDDAINYHGSYSSLLGAAMNSGLRSELRVPHLDDYADYNQVSRCVNENIGDYF